MLAPTPLGVNMGMLMAETFKKMETAHMKDDEWGNYTEYSLLFATCSA